MSGVTPAIKNFECRNCGFVTRRPTAPLSCSACGQQRIGLFRVTDKAPSPPANTPPASPPSPAPPSPAPTTARSAPISPPPPTAPISPPPSPPSPQAAAIPRAAVVPREPASSEVEAEAERPAVAAVPVATEAAPAADGDIAWRFPDQVPGQDYSTLSQRNCLAVGDDGSMYVAIGAKLFCLQEQNDKPRVVWEYSTAGVVPGSPVVGPDANIRLHAGDGHFHVVSPEGRAVWTPLAVREPLGWANPLVDAQGNTWLSDYTGGLTRVTPQGVVQKVPYFRSRQKFDSTGLIRNGILYIGAEDAFVYAIDLTANRGRNIWDHHSGRGQTEWFINSALAWHPDDLLIVAGRDEFLYAFEEDGRIRWKIHLRGQMLASPVISSQGRIYVGVSLLRRGQVGAGKLVAIDCQSRQVAWEFPAQGAIESTPLIGEDGTVYFGDNTGRVYAVASDGGGRWVTNVGSAVRSAGSLPRAGRVTFGLDDGTIVTLACSSKALDAGGWPKFLRTSSNFWGNKDTN